MENETLFIIKVKIRLGTYDVFYRNTCTIKQYFAVKANIKDKVLS